MAISRVDDNVSFPAQSDGQIWYGAPQIVPVAIGDATLTRAAANNYYWLQAASLTVRYAVDLSDMMRRSGSRGLRIDSIDLVYGVDVGTITSITPALATVTHADSAATVVAALGGSITWTPNLPLTVDTDPRVCNGVPATPAYVTTALVRANFEVVAVTPASNSFRLYAVGFRVTHALT